MKIGIVGHEAAKFTGRRLGVQQSTMYRWLAGERAISGPVAAAVKCWLKYETGARS